METAPQYWSQCVEVATVSPATAGLRRLPMLSHVDERRDQHIDRRAGTAHQQCQANQRVAHRMGDHHTLWPRRLDVDVLRRWYRPARLIRIRLLGGLLSRVGHPHTVASHGY